MRLPWRKDDWDHYEFRRARWPLGIMSWTFKRSVNPWMWAIFGNDRDGQVPWVHEKQWGWFSWWVRNPLANFSYCIDGLAVWKEGLLGDNAWPKSPTLEKRFWVGTKEKVAIDNAFIVSWVRDSKKGRKMWRPYVRFPLPFHLAFWCGYKPTDGHSTMSIKRISS